MAMEARGDRQNYLALNDGYESDAPSEDWISSPLSPEPKVQKSRAHQLYLTPSVNRQSVQTSILVLKFQTMRYCLQNQPHSLQSQLPVSKLPTQLPRKLTFRQESFLMNGLRRGTERRDPLTEK
ncbi:hypothetical protein LIPSTDRAFT_202126 [Lipomyces starkeyi NRRL Y-11557]|uniref:Uncharacterized protein n=1 Tax=Lipomyces starkeyi NRRL Y-11557 TaxID=675824 RepID=A0A1E3PW62_LIPST|nr:hypothetical protein LIPSTDRAFT_202126 [Lipomyces starkeyi NRRL Y-11557]